MKNNFVRKISLALLVTIGLGTGAPAQAKKVGLFGEYPQGEILSFGGDLTKKQESELRKKFNVNEDVDAIYVTTEVAVEQLGLDKSFIKTYKGGWYSSAYVNLTNGKGMNVEVDNLTLVTEDMLGNALITSGILNADVVASAPFNVSGESALAGILAGAEEIMGDKISSENKETAQKELETTINVGDEIGKKEASAIMNEIKAEIIKDSPINITQIENIVINVTNNYGVELSGNTRAKVVDTMSDINDLDIDYKEVKKSLKDVGDKLFSDLRDTMDNGKEIGLKIKESGFFQKIWSGMRNMWTSFLDLFRNNKSENENAEKGESKEVLEDENVIAEDALSGDEHQNEGAESPNEEADSAKENTNINGGEEGKSSEDIMGEEEPSLGGKSEILEDTLKEGHLLE